MIALITQLHWNNLGTALQAYALHKKLLMLGCDNEYIDCVDKRSSARVFVSKLKQFALRILRALHLAKPNSNYWETELFKGTFDRTEDFRISEIKRRVFTPSELHSTNSTYEKFIVGSDQMWFPDAILRGNDPVRLLDFVTDNTKKYSYAPSFGTTNLSDDFIGFITKRIQAFNLVSCRERSNANLLASKTKREVSFVLDPTMLLPEEHWRTISKCDINHPKGEYILCYILGTKDCISEYAEKMGKKNDCPVYYILTHPHYATKQHCIKDVGPREFVHLIDNCKVLVTDSFHGIMFSVIFKKPFYVFTKLSSNASNNDNDRIMEVLREFNLVERFCKDDVEAGIIEPIKYDSLMPNIETLIHSSEVYLQNVIND